jgi:hypothetical protein
MRLVWTPAHGSEIHEDLDAVNQKMIEAVLSIRLLIITIASYMITYRLDTHM